MAEYNHVYLIHAPETDDKLKQEALLGIRELLGVSVVSRPYRTEPGVFRENDLLFTLLDDDSFKLQWKQLKDVAVTLAPLPCADNPLSRKVFNISANLRNAVVASQNPEAGDRRHLFLVDGEVVLDRVQIGKSPKIKGDSWIGRIRSTIRSLRGLRMYPFDILTGKEQKTEVAALFMEVGLESAIFRKHPSFFADDRVHGRVTALIYAPKSLLSFFRIWVLKRWRSPRHALPQGVASIKSRRLTVSALSGKAPCIVDGVEGRLQELDFASVKTACRVLTGYEPLSREEDADKESLRVSTIPATAEEVEFYLKRRLPLLPIAAEQDFADLFKMLRKNAVFSSVFATLMVLASLLATLGLLQNSAPVIIGAMILAPLMAPIVSLSMGLLRYERNLIRDSVITLLSGVVMALGLAALLAWWLPFDHFTQEIDARLHPTLLDLGVAILSGIAAAYAYSREEIAKSLAGVAIAVALVPPLNVAGIGIGWLDLVVFQGAFLLFLTNLVGIIVAAGITFYVLGFASLRYVRSAFLYKLMILFAVSVPLLYSTATLIQEDDIYQRFQQLGQIEIAGRTIQARLLTVRQEDGKPVASIRLRTATPLTPEQLGELARRLKSHLGSAVELQWVYFYGGNEAD